MVINPTIFNSDKWQNLSGSIQAAIISALLIRADKITMKAYPSIETIAADTRTSSRTVNRALPELEKKGCLIINKSYKHYMKKGRNTIKRKNEYDLSTWKRFCRFEKTAKSGQNDVSQDLP
jgi:DNA-binding transcriptional regulator YhcF (GntR family)